MHEIKIAIATDSKTFSKDVTQKLNFDTELKVIIEAENSHDLIYKIENQLPQIVLIDIRMPDVDGIQAVRIIREKYREIKIIVLTQILNEDNIITMYRLGVRSFLTKGGIDQISRIVKLINSGGSFWTDEFNSVFQNRISNEYDSLPFDLSEFEHSLIRELSKGKSCTELGAQYFKSPRTIEKYRADLYLKFGVENKEQLISVAAKYLLI